ncbi:hypothetical protein [Streptomyces sp. NPDC059278]|uniref:hypothetical protein n=1 Tax=Streptomyces sp. NPDC059278 TaxID=3346801 RepID=UPI0036C873F4
MRLGPVDSGPLEFRLEGAPYTLLIPADGLLVCGWAATGDWFQLLPGCLDSDSQDSFYDMLGDPYGPVGLRTCWRLAMGMAKAVYGVEWHVAARLANTAQQHWDVFAAWTVTVGFDPAGAPAHRVCAAALAWLRSGCQEEKDFRKMDAQIYAPPKVSPARGRTLRPGFSKQEQAVAWQKALAELGSG